jgi:hypothetical protein
VKLIGRTANLNAVATSAPPPSPMDPPGSALASGKQYFGRRTYSDLGDIFYLTNQGDSAYHSGTLEVERRFGLGFGIHGSYTFSKTMSDGGVDTLTSLGDFPEAPGLDERALSRQHLAPRFTLSFLYGRSDLNVAPVAGFGTPRDVFNPRQIQIGFKLKF